MATAPVVTEVHFWRKAGGALFYQINDGAVVAPATTGAPSGANGCRLVWGAANAGSGDANARAFKPLEMFWATERV